MSEPWLRPRVQAALRALDLRALGLRTLALWGVVAAAYVVAGRLSLGLFVAYSPLSSAVWPAAGLAVAAVLLGGRRMAVPVAVGAFLVNATAARSPGLLAAAAIAVGNACEALVVATLARRFAGGPTAFNTPRNVLLFAVAAADGALVSSVVGSGALLASGLAIARLPGAFLTWWVGDVVGIVIVAPALVLWATDSDLRPLRRRAGEVAALCGACLALAVVMVALSVGTTASGTQLRFLALPVVLWAGYRFGPREAAATVVLLSVLSIAAFSLTPAPTETLPWALLFLQAFLGVAALTGLVVAAVVRERRVALDALGTARDELELRVSVRTAALETALDDLERSNRDLQEFAYVARHDLQEPLRSVAGYTQLLQHRYKEKLPPEAQTYIQSAVDGAVRMQGLINGLLSFSRVGTHGQPLKPVSLDGPVRVALRNLESALSESGAVVDVAPLPTVLADEDQVAQLIQNLVGNAVKFRAPGMAPRIRVSATPPSSGTVTVSVADNGIGIESRHHDRIFVIFQRLHAAGQYPGSGIGLALAKRIVERHGGRIWVESEVGRGSTFRFTLRAADPVPAPPLPAVAAAPSPSPEPHRTMAGTSVAA